MKRIFKYPITIADRFAILLPKGFQVLRIRREQVQEDARIDRGDQTASASPRISPIRSSVRRSVSMIPVTAVNGSVVVTL